MSLHERIETEWLRQRLSWLDCHSIVPEAKETFSFWQQFTGNVRFNRHRRLPVKGFVCPSVWAQAMDRLNCANVWQFTSDEDLSTGRYFDVNIALQEQLLAMAGYRLAYILNRLLDPQFGEGH